MIISCPFCNGKFEFQIEKEKEKSCIHVCVDIGDGRKFEFDIPASSLQKTKDTSCGLNVYKSTETFKGTTTYKTTTRLTY